MPRNQAEWERAREIGLRYAAGGITQQALAREYGMSLSSVWLAIHADERPGLTPAQRTLRARMAAHTRWGHCEDRAAATAAATRASHDRFLREVDPEGTLPPEERQRRAEAARSAYMARIALASARARGRRKAQDAIVGPGPARHRGVREAAPASEALGIARERAAYQAARNRHELGPWQPVAEEDRRFWALGGEQQRARCGACGAWAYITAGTPPRGRAYAPAGEAVAHDCYALQRIRRTRSRRQ